MVRLALPPTSPQLHPSSCAAGKERAGRSPTGLAFRAVSLLLLLGSCASDVNRFSLIDVRRGGDRHTYVETLSEAVFCINEAGTVDVVLRRNEPAAPPDDQVTQLLHLHGVWRSIPGQTVAESTQVNGTVVYAVQYGRSGSTYEGGGSLFFTLHDGGEEIRGSLDRAILRPARHLAAASDVFQHVEIRGTFRARRDDRQTVRLLNEIDRRFGPSPTMPVSPPPKS